MRFKPYPKYKPSGVEWLGEVPEEWISTLIKYEASFVGGSTPSKDEPKYWNGDIPWVSPKDMKMELILDTEDHITSLGVANSAVTLIPPGNVLLVVRSGILKHTIPVALNSIFVTLNQDMKGVLFGPRVHSHFFLRWVQGNNRDLLSVWSKQGATVESIEHAYFANSPMYLPPIEEQTTIAAFLDRETAKIDTLIAKQEKLIELLKEKRQAVISHAVTKGLDPSVPMRDSGVEWLGNVPAHWTMMTLTRITISKCDGPFGSGLKSEHYTDSGARVVRLQNIRALQFYGSDAAFIDLDYFQSDLARHDVQERDLLIAGLGDDRNLVGRACVAPPGIAPALVKADCFRFRLDESMAVPEYIAMQLCCSAEIDAGTLSTGSTRSRIPLYTMASRVVVLPPVCEQIKVVEYIESQSSLFDALIAKAKLAIALQKEHRTALISAAVTGKIDVRSEREVREVVF